MLLNLDHSNVDDIGWIKVSDDNTNVFGLPLQTHIRSEAYSFWYVCNQILIRLYATYELKKAENVSCFHKLLIDYLLRLLLFWS